MTALDPAVRERAARALFVEEQCDRRQAQDVEANWMGRLDDSDRDEYRTLATAALTASGLPEDVERLRAVSAAQPYETERELAVALDAARTELATLRQRIEGLVERAVLEVSDAKAGATYAAEVDQAVLLASEEARRYAWEIVERLARALLSPTEGEQPDEGRN